MDEHDVVAGDPTVPAAALPSRPENPLPVYVRSSTQPPWRAAHSIASSPARDGHGVVVAEPAVVDLDVVVADRGVGGPSSASASLASSATSGWPATTPLATPIASTGGGSDRPAARSSARPATSPAWVPPLDDVNTIARGAMPAASHWSSSSA